jgi:hypothetical protein
MATWSSNFNGTYGGYYTLFVTVDVLGQEAANNRTLVRYNAWWEKTGSPGSAYNGYGTTATTNKNGAVEGRGMGSYNMASLNQRIYFAQNEDLWINHDGNGDANPYFAASYDTGTVGSASAGGNVAMPHINRYANITSFTSPTITDEKVVLNWSADANCDYVSWWSVAYDGGTHHDIPVTGSGVFSVTLTKLKSEKVYDFHVAVRRADSGLWTNSGLMNATTKGQNNFMSMFRL